MTNSPVGTGRSDGATAGLIYRNSWFCTSDASVLFAVREDSKDGLGDCTSVLLSVVCQNVPGVTFRFNHLHVAIHTALAKHRG